MRVCQFRHDGKWTFIAVATARPPSQEELHFYCTVVNCGVKQALELVHYLRSQS